MRLIFLQIIASEEYGYEDAAKFCFMYRDRYNDRVTSEDNLLSEFLWKRIKVITTVAHCKLCCKLNRKNRDLYLRIHLVHGRQRASMTAGDTVAIIKVRAYQYNRVFICNSIKGTYFVCRALLWRAY